MRRKILIALAIGVGTLLGVVLLALLYLNFADLGTYRSTVENLLTDVLGREVRIEGGMEVDFGFNPRVEAHGITLANPEWSDEPSMVAVDRLALEINLASLIFKPIRINELEIDGATVLLEATGDGRANWQFETEENEPGEPSGPIRLSVGRVGLTGSRLDLRAPSLDRPLNLVLDRLDVRSDASDELAIQLKGNLNESDLTIGGRVGTLVEILALGSVSHNLDLSLGNVEVALIGKIGDLATLRGADVELTADGPTMSEMTDLLGLPSFGAGPFHVEAVTAPSGDLSSLSLACTLGEVTAAASGNTDALLAPEIIDLEFRTSGPSIAAVAALAGIRDVVDEPFSASGHLRWEGFPIEFSNVEASVGSNTVSLDGTLGQPPTMLGTDFRFAAGGPDFSAIALLGDVDMPADPFEINGRLNRLEHGVGVEEVEVVIGRITARIHGTVGDPPEFDGTDLQIDAKGPRLAALSGLVGVALPPLPFAVAGRLVPEGDSVVLEGVNASLGPNTARIQGTVVTSAGFTGTSLQLMAEGPDLAWLEEPTGFTDLPRKSYRIEGGVQVDRGSYRLRDVNARVGDVTARVDGVVGAMPGFNGTDVTVLAEGPDFSIPTSLVGIAGVPERPFRIQGGVRTTGYGIDLDAVEARIGEGRINLSGSINTTSDGVGTRLVVDGAGPDASVFDSVIGEAMLPPDPYSFSGTVRVDSRGFVLESATADLGWGRAEVEGVLVPEGDFTGTDLKFTISAPDLSEVGSIANSSGFVNLPELPEKPLTVTGGAAVDADGYALRDLDITFGRATAEISGRLGPPPQFRGTDLTVVGDGPDASLFTAFTGVTVPVAPFRVNGRMERLAEGFHFHSVWLQLAEYRATANGILGEPPKLIGTDLSVGVSGPSLVLISRLAGIADLPDLPFGVEGRFSGDPRRFRSEEFSATLGASDLQGDFRVDLAERPQLTGTFTSHRADVKEVMRPPAPVDSSAESDDSGGDTSRGRVISNQPLDLSVLDTFDADVKVRVGELHLPTTTIRDFHLDATLQNGTLDIDPIQGTGAYGGTLNGRVSIAPSPSGRDYRAVLALDDGRVDVSSVDDDPSDWPSLDVEIDLAASGLSPQEIAESADGRFILVLGEGVMDNSIADLIAADFLVKLLETLNPFRSEGTASRFDCAVMVVDFTDGVAQLDPMAFQTDKMTILGNGKVDLSTERINLDWVTKPRKGIGVSASLLTNPYIRVGGTLSDPSIEMKPIEAAASTGLAVATGGLSLLGQGLLDRITADQKVCEKAIARAEKKLAKKAARQ